MAALAIGLGGGDRRIVGARWATFNTCSWFI